MRAPAARAVAAGVAVAALAGLGACGSSGGPKTASAPSARPGIGKPPVLLGAKPFAEQRVLGELYAQALRAQGYDVRLKRDVSAERIHTALANGHIDGYLEYTDKLLSSVARQRQPPTSAQAAYDAAKAFEAQRGLTVLDRAPFANVDAVAVRRSFARQHGLRQVGDLRRVGSITLGGPRALQTRRAGLAHLRRAYGLTRMSFKPLSIGQQYTALDKGQIQAAHVSSTDARLHGGRYMVLAEPRHVFGFGQVIPIVNRQLIAAQGPRFAQTINALSAKLSTGVMQELNAAVELDKQSPEAAARRFLDSHGLRPSSQ